jgi:hypothetical protein
MSSLAASQECPIGWAYLHSMLPPPPHPGSIREAVGNLQGGACLVLSPIAPSAIERASGPPMAGSGLFPPPALGERCHRGLARQRVDAGLFSHCRLLVTVHAYQSCWVARELQGATAGGIKLWFLKERGRKC